ncbi:MAG TPA: TolC family outer membrane protein [Gallionellaceae bacterium]|nr:TolC family outer membrane protein [Gallionellaceae bacterium]
MNRKKRIFIALSVLGIGLPAYGADLLETYHAAQGKDPVFAGARASHQAGQEKLTQGRSLMLPSVNFTANSTYNNNNVQYNSTSPYPSGTSRFVNNGAAITLVQPLFRQNNWVLYNESELQVAQADAQFKNAEQDLILRVAQAYFDVLTAQDNVTLTAAQKTAIAEQLAQARRNFEVGSATITDTHEAQARYDLIVSQEIAAQSNLEIKRRSLQQLTSEMPYNLQPLGAAFKLEAPQPADVEKWVEQAQQGNLQVAVAQANAELAEKEVDRNRGGHYPTLDLVASYGKSKVLPVGDGTFGAGNNAIDTDNTNASVGVQLNIPLFQGGATQSKWREAEANRDRAREDLESAHRNVDLQTRQAYVGVVNGIAQVNALLQAQKSSESLLEASKLGQEVGVRTNLDVLNAQQQLYSTRRDLYQAEYNYLLSRLRLKAAIGALAEDELAVVNQSLYAAAPQQNAVPQQQPHAATAPAATPAEAPATTQ